MTAPGTGSWITLLIATSATGGMAGLLFWLADPLVAGRRKIKNEGGLCDPATGLASPALMADRAEMALNGARRIGHRVGIIVLNLDGMASVNQRLGRESGDRLLMAVGERCKRCVRQSDTVCHPAEDTFVLVLPTLRREGDVERVARKLLKDIAKPYRVGSDRVVVTATAGLAIFPDDGDSVAALFAAAQNGVAEGKRSGKNRYVRGGSPKKAEELQPLA